MKTIKTNFKDFEADKLSVKQQKAVRGGDDEINPPNDPGKGRGGNG
ncbi:rSAM-modified peptide [Flavobacterium daemonense]|nr:rSAM-modified peptide [Flavobacterium daemonense]KAF2336212.1 rSAM-modified peptide [Flavobacterium daemonense]